MNAYQLFAMPQEPVLKVWRVEKLKLVPVKDSTYGQFYSGDSYLVYWDRDGRSGKELQLIRCIGSVQSRSNDAYSILALR